MRLKWEGTGIYSGDICRAPVSAAGYVTQLYDGGSDTEDLHFRIGTGRRGREGPIVDLVPAYAGIDIHLPRINMIAEFGGRWYPGCADCGSNNLIQGESIGGLPWAQSWHISGTYECIVCCSLFSNHYERPTFG